MCEGCFERQGRYWYCPGWQANAEWVCWRCLLESCDSFGYSPQAFGMSKDAERMARKRIAASSPAPQR